ncbi:MAG: methyltransferase domain-containing protein [Dinoroseobacter sp.]|nr:methyltransferase domain-containing protein [Dinoroseobacter sp.]
MSKTARPDKLGLAARRAALALSTGVREHGKTMGEQVSDPDGPLADLTPEDRARAQRLAAELFRYRARADKLMDAHLQKPPAAAVRDILRLGVIELCVDRAAAHGVVDAAVTLTRMRQRHAGSAGLVNALLRKIAEDGNVQWSNLPVPRLPGPLRKKLTPRYGPKAVAAMEAAHMAGAPIDLSFKTPEGARIFAEETEAEMLPTGSVRLKSQAQVTALPGYDSGDWWVQDAGAALAVKVLKPVSGERIADLCAAPGGKTLQLAAAGTSVVALDSSKERLKRLHENLDRCGLEADVQVGDAQTWTPDAPLDAILLDAPCSATGTIRRHPELPFLRSGDRIDSLLNLQAKMIDHALSLLKPGGRLVYCTCSLLAAEGEAQLDGALMRNPSVEIMPMQALELGIPDRWLTKKSALRLRPDYWPDHGGIDGFFIGALRKPA